jgi:hypothetical protein
MLNVVMPGFIILSANKLRVIRLSVGMLSVVAPLVYYQSNVK